MPGNPFYVRRRTEKGWVDVPAVETPTPTKPPTREEAAKQFYAAIPELIHKIEQRLIHLHEQRDKAPKGPNHVAALTKEIERYQRRRTILSCSGRLPFSRSDGTDQVWCDWTVNLIGLADRAKLVAREDIAPDQSKPIFESSAPSDVSNRIKALAPAVDQLAEMTDRQASGEKDEDKLEAIRDRARAYRVIAAGCRCGWILSNDVVDHLDRWTNICLPVWPDASAAGLIRHYDMPYMMSIVDRIQADPPDPAENRWWAGKNM